MQELELLFVYNADSGLFSTLSDFAHKIISPSTYHCNLCALTYGNFLMKKDWKSFIENLNMETAFLYKDQFMKKHGAIAELPAVFLIENGLIKQLITKSEIESCRDLNELKALIKDKTNIRKTELK